MPEESDIAAPDAAQLAETQAKPVAVPEAATQETEDERGPEMAYYLGQHPEVCDHLNSLSAAGAVKYLGRLSERLFPENSAEEETEESGEASEEETARARAPVPRAAVQAPAPLKPVKKPAPTATGLADDLPMSEWVKRREAQLRKK